MIKIKTLVSQAAMFCLLFNVSTIFAQTGVTVAGDPLGNSGSAANRFSEPDGIYVDSSGAIYVADQDNQRIQKWLPGATSGTTVAGGNGYGTAANQLSPWSVSVDGSGAIYVVDGSNNRVQKWLPGATSGTTVAGGNGAGSNANQFNYPVGLSVDGSGAIYVADASNNRIQKWLPGATSGTTVAGGNGYGSAANQLANPNGIYVDGSGAIYVADEGNQRIQKWLPSATSGTTVAGGNGYGSAADQFFFPQGVALDGSGAIYVADNGNNRIQKWLPGATSGTTVAGQANGIGGTAANQLNGPFGVYVDGNGAIYVSDAGNNRVQKWLQPGFCPTPILSNSGAGCLRDVMTLSNTATATSIVWNKNGIAVSRLPLQTTYHPGLRGVYSATVTYSNGCVVTSNLDTLVDYYVPSVAFSYNRFQAKVCIGTNITFTAFTNSPGTAPHYQWRVSGQNRGTDSTGFTYVPTNFDTVTCILTTNARCIVKPSVVSGNKAIVTVYNHPCPRNVPSLQNGSYKMEEEKAFIFNIYPNPASSVLNCNIATEGDLQIVNEIGQAVIAQHLTNQQTQINIQQLVTGVYFYTFQSEGQVFRGKVVKE